MHWIQYEQQLEEIQKTIQQFHPIGSAKHVGLLELAVAVQEICVDYRVHQLVIAELLRASKEVLDGLNNRIDAADSRSVPVFDGIANLAAAIERADREIRMTV